MNTIHLSVFYSTSKLNLSLICHFWFISNKIYFNIFCSVHLNFFQPFTKICECIISSNIIGKENTMGSPIKYTSNRSEWFLSSLNYKEIDKKLEDKWWMIRLVLTVSHIYSLTTWLFIFRPKLPNSTPIVTWCSSLKSLSITRFIKHDLPTPVSPIMISLNK